VAKCHVPVSFVSHSLKECDTVLKGKGDKLPHTFQRDVTFLDFQYQAKHTYICIYITKNLIQMSASALNTEMANLKKVQNYSSSARASEYHI